MAQLLDWITHAWKVFNYSTPFMTWNLFLAFIPLILSIWLFRLTPRRSLLWWVTFGIFVAFLPNAPYVLTDIIHLITLIRFDHSVWTITLVLIPQYLFFIFSGLEAYVISLINLGYYYNKLQWGKSIIWVELVTHLLCALGIYLGRFQRFNSWDILTKPDYLMHSIVDNLTGKWSVMTISVTFLILVVLHWLMKEITLGIIERFRYRRTINN
jgi:uncharacterized membrane protein